MRNIEKDLSGEDVKLVQQRLKEFGFYEGEISGDFDEKTEEAVKYFQESEGLAVDGIVGLMTLHALDLLKPEITE